MTTPIGLKTPTGWDLNQSIYDEIDELPLMPSPGPVLMILAMYLLFILKLGPAYMRKREPYKLKYTLIMYNFLQVVISLYLVIRFSIKLYDYGIFPRKCLMTPQDTRREMIFNIWLYFAAKITELLDTVFFILRKKNNQVTFLHVYHHSIMLVGTWAFLKYSASHTVLYIGFINSLVHVFMYTYYGLAALGPSVAKYLTWKKYMTTFQLIQFITIIIQYVISVRVSECPPSKNIAILIACNTGFFLLLFSNFYRQSYTKKAAKAVLKTENQNLKTMYNHKEINEKCQ